MMRFLFIFLVTTSVFSQTSNYVPLRSGDWQTKTAKDVSINDELLKEAISFAEANAYSQPKDIRLAIYKGFAREPFHELKGPTRERGNPQA